VNVLEQVEIAVMVASTATTLSGAPVPDLDWRAAKSRSV